MSLCVYELNHALAEQFNCTHPNDKTQVHCFILILRW